MESREPLFTEPQTVPCLYITGMTIEIEDSAVLRFVAWVRMPHLTGEYDERRIVARYAMSDQTARDFVTKMRRALARGGN